MFQYLLLWGLVCVTACGQIDHTSSLLIGTDSPEYLLASSVIEEQVTGVRSDSASGSANAGASLDRPVYQLTDNRSIALRHSLHRKVNSNVAIEASATIESAYRSYFLP